MASFLSCLATSAAWCCCTASMSLVSSCCGNDKSSSVPPSATSGRKRSVFLLILTIAIALGFQYGVGPYVIKIPISNYVTRAWTMGCTHDDASLQRQCVGNQGVYRATASALIFFLVAALAAACKPTANREAWAAKYILFLFLALGACFIPNDPVFSQIYLHIGRIGAVIFVIMEQIIILDLAFNWNDSWVEKANQAETEQQGKKWLDAIIASCAILFAGSLTGIGLLYAYFDGCGINIAFITITLLALVGLTALQLSGEEASLLASATIGAYGTYICYTAVTKNPNAMCNPTLGDQDVLGIVLGIAITIMSLAWTGYSYTAETRVDGDKTDLQEALVDDNREDAAKSRGDDDGRKVQGIVVTASDDTKYGSTDDADEEQPSGTTAATNGTTTSKPVSWRLNLILAMISCWIAMSLTGWGAIEAGGTAANPNVSRISMWMLIASQWVMYLLYGWTLVAPRLFPDRDFS